MTSTEQKPTQIRDERARVASKWGVFGLASLLALSVAPNAFARSHHFSPRESPPHFEEEEGRSHRKRMSKEERKALREKIHQKVQRRLAEELSSRLRLDEYKSEQLANALEKHGDARKMHGKRLRQEMKTLKKLVSENASDAELRRQMDVLAEARQQRKDGMQSLLRETESFLTTKEQATLMLAFPRVMKDTRRMMRKARHERRGGHRHHEQDERDDRDDRDEHEPFGFEN